MPLNWRYLKVIFRFHWRKLFWMRQRRQFTVINFWLIHGVPCLFHAILNTAIHFSCLWLLYHLYGVITSKFCSSIIIDTSKFLNSNNSGFRAIVFEDILMRCIFDILTLFLVICWNSFVVLHNFCNFNHSIMSPFSEITYQAYQKQSSYNSSCHNR